MEIINEKQTPKRNFKRSLIVFIGNVLGIYLIFYLGLGVEIGEYGSVILLVLFISLINALLWPILTRIAMPFLVLTFGIGTLILNGLLTKRSMSLIRKRNSHLKIRHMIFRQQR